MLQGRKYRGTTLIADKKPATLSDSNKSYAMVTGPPGSHTEISEILLRNETLFPLLSARTNRRLSERPYGKKLIPSSHFLKICNYITTFSCLCQHFFEKIQKLFFCEKQEERSTIFFIALLTFFISARRSSRRYPQACPTEYR